MTDPAAATDETSPPHQPLAQRCAEIALILLVIFVAAGDPPPAVNEAHYLARLKHYWNPRWCAGDLFLESTDTQLLFIWTFGWLTRWLSLSTTAWISRFVAWTLLAWAWQRLSWRLLPVRLAAVLSAALFIVLTALTNLAGEWVVGGVEAKCFAYVLVLIALRDMLDRRWNAVWFLLGAATAFHPIVGGWSGLACAAVWLLNDRCRTPLLAMTPGLVTGALVALVGVVPALALARGAPPDVVAESARIYVFERLPHHLALLTLPRNELMARIARHGALVLALWLLMRATRQTLITPVAPALRSMPPLGVAAGSLHRIGQFAWCAIGLAILGFAIELVLWHYPLLAAKLLRYYWFRLTDFAVPLAVAIYGVAWIVDGLERRRVWAPWTLTAVLVCIGVFLADLARDRALHPVPPADARVADLDAWLDACTWIAQNTPPDALFLTPRSSQTFKWYAERPELANRKDLPQDAPSMLEWDHRLHRIFWRKVGGRSQWRDSPAELDAEYLKQLAAEYRFDYILAERRQLLPLPIAYMNQNYVVYRLPK